MRWVAGRRRWWHVTACYQSLQGGGGGSLCRNLGGLMTWDPAVIIGCDHQQLKRHSVEHDGGSNAESYEYDRGARIPPVHKSLLPLPLILHVAHDSLDSAGNAPLAVIPHPQGVATSSRQECIELLVGCRGVHPCQPHVHVRRILWPEPVVPESDEEHALAGSARCRTPAWQRGRRRVPSWLDSSIGRPRWATSRPRRRRWRLPSLCRSSCCCASCSIYGSWHHSCIPPPLSWGAAQPRLRRAASMLTAW